MDHNRLNVLGVQVSAIDMQQALDAIASWIRAREAHYVCVTPAHSVMDCYHDPALRRIFNRSGLTTPDGMPLVWLLRLSGYRHAARVYGPDLMQALCARSLDAGYRHFFYGGTPEVLADLVRKLQSRYPGLQVAGSYSPPFRPLTPEEDREVAAIVRAARPDVLWVGIGSPRQEQWMAAHLDRLDTPALIGVGAAFDFLSGHKRQAPGWMRRAGLEWLFRLLSEPRRLWRRYARMPLFVWLVALQRAGLKRFDVD